MVVLRKNTEVVLPLLIGPDIRTGAVAPPSVLSVLVFFQALIYIVCGALLPCLEVNPEPKQLPYATDVLKIKIKAYLFLCD